MELLWVMLEVKYLSLAQTGYSICASLFSRIAHFLEQGKPLFIDK